MAKGDKRPVLMTGDKAVPSGVATLDSAGNVPYEQLGNVTGEQLLDNAYFLRPVNQRGQTEYVAPNFMGLYSIDRWGLQYAGAKIVPSTSGIEVYSGSASEGPFQMRQSLNSSRLKPNTYYTFSVVSDISNAKAIFTWNGTQQFTTAMIKKPWGFALTFKTLATACTESTLYLYTNGAPSEKLGTIEAGKLEEGSTPTIVHQDADGNWVLNEIPDYGEELRKCQRYQVAATLYGDGVSSASVRLGVGIVKSATELEVFVPLPVSMRARPNVTAEGLYFSDANGMFAAIYKTRDYSNNGVRIIFTIENGTKGSTGFLHAGASGGLLLFDANL